MTKSDRTPLANPRRIKVAGPDGRKVNGASLPLVAYALNCGHLGRNYAVKRRDFLFCEECGTTKQVAKILAQ